MEVYISKGNQKMGDIPNISLSLDSCSDIETETCDHCYIKHNYYTKFSYHFWYQNFMFYNFDKDGFFESFKTKLNLLKPKLFRFFVSGDFPDSYFIQKTIDLVKNFNDTKFFVYTRSWQRDDCLELLKELNKLKNFIVLTSFDKKTKNLVHKCNGLFKVYFINDDKEEVPEGIDLIFRNRHLRDTRLVYKDRVLVCPKENGVNIATCEKCKWCFDTLPKRRGKI